LEIKETTFAHFLKSAEFIENKGDRLPLANSMHKLYFARRVKPAGWANWIGVSLPDVCAADWRVTASLFPIRINYYLMRVKRRNESAGKSKFHFSLQRRILREVFGSLSGTKILWVLSA
jgi:hypothetical protein